MSDLWRDMDFALPAGHPSTWEKECKQLRARVAELEEAMWQAIDLVTADLQFDARNTLRAALKGGDKP